MMLAHVIISRSDVLHMKNTVTKYTIDQILISAAAVVMALSYQLFIVPNHFAPAGLNGIATMIQFKTGFSIAYMSLIINVPMCIFAYFFINRKYAVSTLIFVMVYSFSFLLFQHLGLEEFQYNANGHNTIYPVILSGIINGAIYGICFRKNSSTGGTDIVSKYISCVKPRVNFFWVTFVLNAIVVVISFFVYAQLQPNGTVVYDYEPVCLSILYCFLTSFIGNKLLKGTKMAAKFTIITEHADKITDDISKELKHGSTQIHAIGSYTKDEKSIVICVVNTHQIVDLKNILSRYENTFSFSEVINETYGNFKKIM